MKKNEILIVDDEIISQNMVRTALTNAGYSVVTASNGMEGIKLAMERLPNLIVLDIMMPDIDGGEVAEILRKDPKTMNIPIIFLSSLVSKEEEKTGGKKDIVSFLSKPYNREKLLNEVRKYLYKDNP
jgi:two-component system sensor histidine kinase/response regulator